MLPKTAQRRAPKMTSDTTGAANSLVITLDDEQWRIYELAPASYDRRGSNTLVFETDGVIRRVRNFPRDWRELSPEALLALSWTA
jgi:hypothetical protein